MLMKSLHIIVKASDLNIFQIDRADILVLSYFLLEKITEIFYKFSPSNYIILRVEFIRRKNKKFGNGLFLFNGLISILNMKF